ncbi:MAG: hypothetical protein HQL61_09070 [Magnetococcales bacterium]|nr:hypothetical protein [Nitrospirota bacterium]
MADLLTGNTTVEFKKTCARASEESFTFELDSMRNNSKSVFFPVTDTAYLKLFPGNQQPQFWYSMGSAYVVGSGVDTKTEDITFIDSDSGSLSDIPLNTVTWRWAGRTKGSGSVTFNKSEVKVSDKITGILHVEYQAQYDVVQVTCQQLGLLLLTATKGNRKGNTTVDFRGEHRQEEVYITVKYACTNEVQPDATVIVDGQFVGVTDHEGKVYAGRLASGRHTLKVTKTGFLDSDRDTIANDWFDIS